MKCYHCNSCGLMVFFRKQPLSEVREVSLAFLPDILDLCVLKPVTDKEWCRPIHREHKKVSIENAPMVNNYNTCNWMVPVRTRILLLLPAASTKSFPDLSDGKNLTRWEKLELAKRRCDAYLFETGFARFSCTPATTG